MKRRIRYRGIIVICIMVIVILFAIFQVSNFLFKKKEMILNSENKQYGTYVEKYNDIITYPEFNFDNENLTTLVNSKISSFQEGLDGQGYVSDCSTKLFYNTLVQVDCSLSKENEKLKSESLIYNIVNDKEIKFNDIFRRDTYLLRQIFPKENIDNLNKEKIKLEDDAVIVDNLKVVLSHTRLFKPGNGIKSLYTKNKLKPKKFNYDKTKKMIAFTYDDGPLNNNHDRIRDLFTQHNIPATFYVIGELVDRYPDKILKTYLDGHTIANHTYTHPGLVNENLTTIGPEKAIEEVEKTEDAIFKVIGVDTTTLRPPGGFMDDKTKALFDKKSVLWTVDSQDWRNKHNTKAVYQNVRSGIQENSIVLFHDLYDSSFEATKRLIPELLAEGYQFVDIDTLLERIGES